MKKGFDELVIIIDKSGSMSGLEKDVVGGYNALIEKTAKEEKEALVTTVFFDTRVKTVLDRTNTKDIAPMKESNYIPSGCTALLDAIGLSIKKVEATLSSLKEDARPEHIVFSIMTDGMENASRKFDYNNIRKLIDAKKEEGWDFLFQAANIDALEEGTKLGVEKDDIASFVADGAGVEMCFSMASAGIARKRGRPEKVKK